MAKHKRHVFHSSRTKTGWVVTEGGETVSRQTNEKGAETAPRITARGHLKLAASVRQYSKRRTG